jgi:hypothetical protein
MLKQDISFLPTEECRIGILLGEYNGIIRYGILGGMHDKEFFMGT